MTNQTASAKGRGRVARLRPLVMALLSAGCASALAVTLPENLQIKAGQGTLTTEGNTMTLKQTSFRSIWEAYSFNLSADARFEVQADKASMTLVRVTGFGQTSQLNGTLRADNNFILVNPYGIHVGSTAVLSAGSLVLSALDLKQELIDNNYAKLMEGAHVVFRNHGGLGDLCPYGGSQCEGLDPNWYGKVDIDPGAKLDVAADGGIMLIGDNVRNQGLITTGEGGQVGLLAVAEAEVQVGDSGFITLSRYADDQSLDQSAFNRVAINAGTITSPGGNVTLASTGNTSRSGNAFVGSQDEGNSLYQSGFRGGFSSGVFNTGTITAKGQNGKRGSVSMYAQGIGSLAANAGTIDVRSLDASTIGGIIRMSGETVRIGLYHDPLNTDETAVKGTLLADGSTGGGDIDLGDAARQDGDTTDTKWIYVSRESTLSADATDTGKGGHIRLHAMYDGTQNADGTPIERYDYGQVEAYGSFSAQGGANGGSGGLLETFGQAVNLSYNSMVASINVSRRSALEGINGVWVLQSPYIRVGKALPGNSQFDPSHFALTNGQESVVDPLVISGALRGGADVSLAASNDAGVNWAGSGSLSVDNNSQILSSGAIDNRLDMRSDTSLIVGRGTTIRASGGRLNVNMEANHDILDIQGVRTDRSQIDSVATVSRNRLSAAAEFVGSPVTIQTNGGVVTLKGNVDAGAERQSGVRLNGLVLDTRASGSTAGSADSLTIVGSGQSQHGVVIGGNADLASNSVQILGTSQTATGVQLSNTVLGTSQGSIEIYGASQSAQAGGQGIGVDIGANVALHARQGRATILGRAASGIGLRIDDLTLTTSGGVAENRQRFTLVGESVEGGSGIEVLTVAQEGTGRGIQLHDEAGSNLAATADLVVGATAGDTSRPAMELGNPNLNTTGRVNYRPLGVGVSDELSLLQLIESPNTAIHVGDAAGSNGNFFIKPEWFNVSFNPGVAIEAIVIGGAQHAGIITVANGALVGSAPVTLQNQGGNGLAIAAAVGEGGTSVQGGIVLGEQTGEADAGIGRLNLMSSGDITQTGPINVEQLNVFAGPQSTVTLNNPNNKIKALNFSGQTAPDVSTQAVPNAQGATGVLAFSQASNTFQLLAVNAVPSAPSQPNRETPVLLPSVQEYYRQPGAPRVPNGPEVLNDLRTDVYVHGQLSRPQICTAANTAGAGRSLDGNAADSLSLEWTKVRRGAQLTNCSGLQADSNCSAF